MAQGCRFVGRLGLGTLACLALLLPSCGSGDEPAPSGLLGTWKGAAAGVSVTITIERATPGEAGTALEGTARTSRSECLELGTMLGTLLPGDVVQLLGEEEGAAPAKPTLAIYGKVEGGKIVGTLRFAGDPLPRACEGMAPITLSRRG